MMPDENGWHLAEGRLADYAQGRSTLAQAASVETHMTACAHCRSRLMEVLPELPIERMWQQILSETEPAPPSPRHEATGRTTMRPWMTFFRARVRSRRRIGFAVLMLLLCFALAAHPAYPRPDSRSVGAASPNAVPMPAAVAAPPPASRTLRWAGGSTAAISVSRTENTLTVMGKVAGLGDGAPIKAEVSATALCVDAGGQHPTTVGKKRVDAAGEFPVQDGEADLALSVTAAFRQLCSPLMTVQFTDVTLTDTDGLTHSFAGTF